MANTLKNELQTFSGDFTAQTGRVSTDLRNSVSSLLGEDSDSSSTKLLGELYNINRELPEDDISCEYLQQGPLKIGLPKSIRDFSGEAQEALGSVLSVLQSLRSILEALSNLIPQMSDLLSVLLESIFKTLEDLILLFTSVDAKVRALPIPPIHPINVLANTHTVLDKSTAKAFSKLVTSTYGETNISKAYPKIPAKDIEEMVLGTSGSNSVVSEGSLGFLETINSSLEDEKDPNRPTESVGFSIGLVVHAGAPTAQALSVWNSISRLFFSVKKEFEVKPVRGSVPTPQIRSTQHLGFSERSKPLISITIDNPEHRAPKSFFSPPEEVYIPVEILVLGVQNTSISTVQAIRDSGFQQVDKYYSLSEINSLASLRTSEFLVHRKVLEGNENLENISEVGITIFKDPVLNIEFELNKDFVGDITSMNYLFKVVTSFLAFKRLKDGTYAKVNSSSYLYSITRSTALHIPLDVNKDILPVISAGFAPNWIQYGKTWTVPGTEEIVAFLREVLNDLKAFVSFVPNFLTSLVNTYIRLIERLNSILLRLNNLTYLLDKLLNTNIGANIVIFSCDSGVAGIKKAINEYFEQQREEYLIARSKGLSTSDIDWFADGESVCGGVIVATSSTIEQVNRLLSLFELLFGSNTNRDTSGQSLLESPVLTAPVLTPELLGSVPLSRSANNLFTDNFTGIDSSRHIESPESACPSDV